MKSFTPRSILAAVIAMMLAAPSGAAGLEEEGTFTVVPAITSHYLFRGVELAGASFQPWVDYSNGPISVGVWSSFALEDRASGGSDPEVDFYGFYTFRTSSGRLSLIPGFYLYTYPDAERSEGFYSATFEPSLAASFSLAGVQFTPRLYYDVMLEGATYELTAALALPLKTLGTVLDFSATAGTFKQTNVTKGAAPSVKNWGDYWTLGVSVPIQVTLRSKVTVAVTYSEGRNNVYKQGSAPRTANDDAHGRAAVSISYAITL